MKHRASRARTTRSLVAAALAMIAAISAVSLGGASSASASVAGCTSGHFCVYSEGFLDGTLRKVTGGEGVPSIGPVMNNNIESVYNNTSYYYTLHTGKSHTGDCLLVVPREQVDLRVARGGSFNNAVSSLGAHKGPKVKC